MTYIVSPVSSACWQFWVWNRQFRFRMTDSVLHITSPLHVLDCGLQSIYTLWIWSKSFQEIISSGFTGLKCVGAEDLPTPVQAQATQGWTQRELKVTCGGYTFVMAGAVREPFAEVFFSLDCTGCLSIAVSVFLYLVFFGYFSLNLNLFQSRCPIRQHDIPSCNISPLYSDGKWS